MLAQAAQAALSLTKHLAAFEIADDLLRCTNFRSHGVLPLPEHINFLMLLAHSRGDMLRHSSRAIAAAALLTSLRLQAGPAAAAAAAAQLPPAISADGVGACAVAMWAMRGEEDAAPLPPASCPDVAKPATTATASDAGAAESVRNTGQVAMYNFVPVRARTRSR